MGEFLSSSRKAYARSLCSGQESSFLRPVRSMLERKYPIKAREEGMVLQVLEGSAKSVRRVSLIQELGDETLCRFHEDMAWIFHEVGELKGVGHNLIVDLLHVLSIYLDERVFPCKEFIENGSKWPQVSTIGVSLMNEDLRSHVLWCSNEAKGFVLVFIHLLACPHIDQLQVAVSSHHDVLRL